MSADSTYDVAVVGGGVAGRSAGIFTGRHGLDTVIFDTDESIVRRNAHLENYPGFPAGVSARLLLDMMGDQAERAGVDLEQREIVTVDFASGESDLVAPADADEVHPGFVLETAGGATVEADVVVVATKNVVDPIAHIDGVGVIDRGKTFIDTDERGRTGVDGLYAAGRLAEKPHQTIVAAGHGAEVAITILEDVDRAFYHDWIVPEGYFTGRGRDVPPGCEEIDDEERLEREREAADVMQTYFEGPYPEPPEQHPSVSDE